MAELSLPPGVVFDCVDLEAICFAVSTEVDMPSTYQVSHVGIRTRQTSMQWALQKLLAWWHCQHCNSKIQQMSTMHTAAAHLSMAEILLDIA